MFKATECDGMGKNGRKETKEKESIGWMSANKRERNIYRLCRVRICLPYVRSSLTTFQFHTFRAKLNLQTCIVYSVYDANLNMLKNLIIGKYHFYI